MKGDETINLIKILFVLHLFAIASFAANHPIDISVTIMNFTIYTIPLVNQSIFLFDTPPSAQIDLGGGSNLIFLSNTTSSAYVNYIYPYFTSNLAGVSQDYYIISAINASINTNGSQLFYTFNYSNLNDTYIDSLRIFVWTGSTWQPLTYYDFNSSSTTFQATINGTGIYALMGKAEAPIYNSTIEVYTTNQISEYITNVTNVSQYITNVTNKTEITNVTNVYPTNITNITQIIRENASQQPSPQPPPSSDYGGIILQPENELGNLTIPSLAQMPAKEIPQEICLFPLLVLLLILLALIIFKLTNKKPKEEPKKGETPATVPVKPAKIKQEEFDKDIPKIKFKDTYRKIPDEQVKKEIIKTIKNSKQIFTAKDLSKKLNIPEEQIHRIVSKNEVSNLKIEHK